MWQCIINGVLWQLLFYMCEFFIFIQFIYKLMCIITFFYFSCAFFRLRNTTHVYDILCLWQFMYDIGFIFVTTYVHNKLWFYSNFIFLTTYKYFSNYYLICLVTYILYVWQLTTHVYNKFYLLATLFYVCDNSYYNLYINLWVRYLLSFFTTYMYDILCS